MGKEFDAIQAGLEEMQSFLEGKRSRQVRVTTKFLKVSALHRFSPAKIKALRISLGMSQGQFSAALGVKPLTVAKWEQGINIPSGSSLRILQMLTRRPKILEETEVVFFGTGPR